MRQREVNVRADLAVSVNICCHVSNRYWHRYGGRPKSIKSVVISFHRSCHFVMHVTGAVLWPLFGYCPFRYIRTQTYSYIVLSTVATQCRYVRHPFKPKSFCDFAFVKSWLFERLLQSQTNRLRNCVGDVFCVLMRWIRGPLVVQEGLKKKVCPWA